jgi:hypothetical protein
MLSLYDYLGRAAGPNLGLEVAKYAAHQGVKTGIREVSNPKYSGPIKLYTEDFLMSFFNNPNYKTVIKEDEQWYKEKIKKKENNLPF